jgi:hypothetical protein
MKDQNAEQLAWKIIEILQALTDFIWDNYTSDADISEAVVEDINIEDSLTE